MSAPRSKEFTPAFRKEDAFPATSASQRNRPKHRWLRQLRFSVTPHHRLADCTRPDLLLVPGGQGTRKETHNPALTGWIRQASVKAELGLSVCTGALLLARAGLLDRLEATTHHGAIDLLRQTAPKTTVHAGRRSTSLAWSINKTATSSGSPA
jgi:transcriptional regulator GlxA family with amidase domain